MSERVTVADPPAIEDTAGWREIYDANARLYTFLAKGFRLFGIARQRRRMIDALGLRSGDTVVDLCCGSGQNFADLRREVGDEGRVVGIDVSPQMLAIAKDRIDRHGWNNVELIEADVAEAPLPDEMSAAVSTFGLDIVPGVDRIVGKVAERMPAGTRLGLLGSQEPAGWPDWLVRFGVWLNSPCDIEREHLSIRPDLAARRLLAEERHEDFWFGVFYWSVCRKDGDRTRAAPTGDGAC